MHLWEDDKRSVTKQIILKEISTPRQSVPIVVMDGEWLKLLKWLSSYDADSLGVCTREKPVILAGS